MIAGGLGNMRRGARGEGRGAGRRAAHRSRRTGDADRPGRRRRLLGRQRQLQRGTGFRFGAARQSGDPAPRAGGHRPLLGAWGSQSDRADPRRGRGRSVQCGTGGDRTQSARRTHRPAHHPQRRVRHVAARALVQRSAGALRARDRRRRDSRSSRAIARARALPVRRDRRDQRQRPAASSTTRAPDRRRWTCRWTCCSASRRA